MKSGSFISFQTALVVSIVPLPVIPPEVSTFGTEREVEVILDTSIESEERLEVDKFPIHALFMFASGVIKQPTYAQSASSACVLFMSETITSVHTLFVSTLFDVIHPTTSRLSV